MTLEQVFDEHMSPDPRTAYAERSAGVFSLVQAISSGSWVDLVDGNGASAVESVGDGDAARSEAAHATARAAGHEPEPEPAPAPAPTADPTLPPCPGSAADRDAEHNALLDAVRAGLAEDARAFARRVDQLQALARVSAAGAEAGVAQFPELEMAGSWSVSQYTAARWANDAERLTTCLPLTLELLDAGRLFVPSAQVLLTRTRHCSEDVCRKVEAEVLPAGASLCPSDLRKRVDRAVLRITSEQLDPAVAEQQHADAVAERRTFVRAEVDGLGVASALLPAPQLVAWQQGMDRLERRERLADRAAGVERTADQRRADLFAALPAMVLAGTAQDRAAVAAALGSRAAAASTPSAGQDTVDVAGEPHAGEAHDAVDVAGEPHAGETDALVGGNGSGPMTAPAGLGPLPLFDEPLAPWTFTPETVCAQIILSVSVPVATVLDRSREPGHLEGYGPISAEHVRLVRPHSLRRVLVDATSGVPIAVDDRPTPAAPDQQGRREQVAAMLAPAVVTNVDEPQHDPSARLRRLVRLRDQHCGGPGCSVSRCDQDHHDPHPRGPTSERNLRLLSRRCHRAKHHGWTLVRHPHGDTTWISPLGRTYHRPGPHPRPPLADLHSPPPPLRPPPSVAAPRWVEGRSAPQSSPSPPLTEGPPLPPDAVEPPF